MTTLRVMLALLEAFLSLMVLATPAYADTIEPRDWTWAWLLAAGIIALAVAVAAWRALAGLRRRRSQPSEGASTDDTDREPRG